MKDCNQRSSFDKNSDPIDGISPQLVSMCESSNDPWVIKDSKSCYIYGNKALRDFLNLPSNFNFEGRLDSDIPHPISEFAANFQAHDRKVLELKINLSSLDIYPYGRGGVIQPYLCEKTPFFSQNKKNSAVIAHVKKCNFFPTMYFMDGKSPKSLIFDPPEDLFTSDELEVIFLAMHRLSAKEIGKKLNLSDRTIEKRLSEIYQKSDVHFLPQLIDFCQMKGFDRYIPQKFLQPSSQLIN